METSVQDANLQRMMEGSRIPRISSGSTSSHGDISPLSPTLSLPSTPQSRSRPKDRTSSSSTGKTKKGKTSDVYFWTSDDVGKWLRKHCMHMQSFETYRAVFNQHEITGRSLLRMTDSKLQKMNIINTSDREELMRHVIRLKLSYAQHELKKLEHKALNNEKVSEKKK